MTIFSTNIGGGVAPLALPWLRLCFGPPLGKFLRTPLVAKPVTRNKPPSVNYFAVVVLATNKICGAFPWRVSVFSVL